MSRPEALQESEPGRSRSLLLLGRIALGIVEVFFLLFGIYLLVLAYHLTDPFAFIMTFFASNLVILISAVFLLGLVLKFRKKRERGQE
jgi:membrane protein YdbS with pleckstrin-like domain